MPLDPLDPSEFITEPMTRAPVLQIDPAARGFHARGPSLPAAGPRLPTRPPQISEKAETALEQPAGFEPHMIGQRLPATEQSRATQPQPRLVNIETMRALLEPNSTRGDVTIDTHAVAAALLRPLAGKDTEVAHNLATSPPQGQPYAPSSDITGMQGTYGIYADAYRQAAAARGILPRQMQSVTWEAVRGLFTRTYKTPANKQTIDEIWRRYANGQATIEQTRADVLRAAGGINIPDWARPPRAVPRAGADDALRYSGDPAELCELRVYGPGAGYPFSGGGVEPTAGAAPGLTEGAAAALGAGAQ
jgi:hypothetical protein